VTAGLISILVRMTGFLCPLPCLLDNIVAMVLLPAWTHPYFLRAFIIWHKSTFQSYLLDSSANSRSKLLHFLDHRRFLVSIPFQLLFFFVLLVLPWLLVAIIVYFTMEIEPSCFNEGFPPVILLQGCLTFLGGLAAIILLWNLKDALMLKLEYRLLLILGLPGFIAVCLASSLDWKGPLHFTIFLDVTLILTIFFTIWVPVLGSFRFQSILKRRADTFDPSKDSLRDIPIDHEFNAMLSNPVLLKSFEKLVHLLKRRYLSQKKLLFKI